MLSNFQLGGRALHSDLPARPARVPRQARRRPGLEQLRQRVIATHHLDAMDADEVEPYVRPPPRRGRLAGPSRLRARRLRRASTATPAAFRAGSTSSPHRLLLYAAVEQLETDRRRATSRRSPPTWPPTGRASAVEERVLPLRAPAAAAPARREPVARRRARAPDRRARGAARRAGSGAAPRPDPAGRLGRERQPDAPSISPPTPPDGAPADRWDQLRDRGRGRCNAERPLGRCRGLVPGRRLREGDRPRRRGTALPRARRAQRRRGARPVRPRPGSRRPSSPWAGSPSATRR